MARFAGEGWGLSADTDGFLGLPDRIRVMDLTARLERKGARLA